MKSSIRFFHPASVFFLLTVGVAFLSWVGSIYGWEDVQNFLSAEGLRWALRYTDDNYLCAPMLASLLILFLGLGLCIHSRFPEACLRLLGKGIHLSRKECRALGMTAVSLGVYVLLLAFSGLGAVDTGEEHYRRFVWFSSFGRNMVCDSFRAGAGRTGLRICYGFLPERPGYRPRHVVVFCLFCSGICYLILCCSVFCRAGLYRTGRICRHFRDVALLDLHILLPAGV